MRQTRPVHVLQVRAVVGQTVLPPVVLITREDIPRNLRARRAEVAARRPGRIPRGSVRLSVPPKMTHTKYMSSQKKTRARAPLCVVLTDNVHDTIRYDTIRDDTIRYSPRLAEWEW